MHNSSKCYLNASFNFYKTDYETQACQYGRLLFSTEWAIIHIMKYDIDILYY